jgi:hypothetical protein
MFSFSDAFRFKLATQQEDTAAKVQVFLGVFLGVILRWIYAVAVEDQPASMRFWNAIAYGITMDVIVSSWLPAPVC